MKTLPAPVSAPVLSPRQQLQQYRRARGFTLVELLVVLVVLVLLASIIGPRVLGQLGGAKSKTAVVQIAEIEKALEIYALDVGRFPGSAQGLQALVQAPPGVAGWNGPYIKGGVPLDPWGNPYHYAFPGADGGMEIISYGADGAPGGEGENADVRNTQ